jgi:hypothetical protein
LWRRPVVDEEGAGTCVWSLAAPSRPITVVAA